MNIRVLTSRVTHFSDSCPLSTIDKHSFIHFTRRVEQIVPLVFLELQAGLSVTHAHFTRQYINVLTASKCCRQEKRATVRRLSGHAPSRTHPQISCTGLQGAYFVSEGLLSAFVSGILVLYPIDHYTLH